MANIGQTYHVVMKVRINTDDGGGAVGGNDNVSVWVDPASMESEAALGAPTLEVEDFTVSAATAFRYLTLEGSDIDNAAGVRFDELRIGDTLDGIAQTQGFLDFGDAPSATQSTFANTYPVTVAEDGARHALGGLTLGTGFDKEDDGVHSANADNDDTAGVADEDGATNWDLNLGTNLGSVDVDVTGGTGRVAVWVDFNQDGTWAASEKVHDADLAAGTHNLNFAVPATATAGVSYARVRLASAAGEVASPTGAAADGEVEDYLVVIASGSPPAFVASGPFSIAENSPNATAVGDVDANDGDGGGTDVGITFTTTGGTGSTAFDINVATGAITVADQAQLDFETTPSFTLDVQASDGGNLATTTVTINLTDANELPVATDDANSTNSDAVLNVTAPDYSATILADNPLIYWRLGDANKSDGATAANLGSLGAGGNGTYGGAVGNVTDAPIAGDDAGSFGSTTASGSTGDGVRLSTTSFATNAFTVEGWFRGPPSGGDPTLFSYDAGNDNRIVVIEQGGTVRLFVNALAGDTGYSMANILDNQWHHVAVSWTASSSTANLYVDGQFSGSAATSGSAMPASGTFMVGQEQDGQGGGFADSQKFSGDIDEVAVYGAQLSGASIAAHYSAGVVKHLLSNDSDTDGDALIVSQADGNNLAGGTVTFVSAAGASVTVNDDGTYNYDPNGAFNALPSGSVATDTFNYTASDQNGGIDTATVTITIQVIDQLPDAVNDAAAADEDGPAINIDLVANDIDGSLNELPLIDSLDDTGTVGVVSIVSQPAQTLAADADSYIQQSLASTNFGSSSVLRVKTETGTNLRSTYIRFDLGGATLPADSDWGDATLKLTLVDSAAGTETSNSNWEFQVFGLTDGHAGEGWAENAINWNNAPANVTTNNDLTSDAVLLGSFSVVGKAIGEQIDFSSPEMVQFLRSSADDQATFIVRRVSPGESGQTYIHTFASKENGGATGPELELIAQTVSYDPNAQFEALSDTETATDTFTYNVLDPHRFNDLGGGIASDSFHTSDNGAQDTYDDNANVVTGTGFDAISNVINFGNTNWFGSNTAIIRMGDIEAGGGLNHDLISGEVQGLAKIRASHDRNIRRAMNSNPAESSTYYMSAIVQHDGTLIPELATMGFGDSANDRNDGIYIGIVNDGGVNDLVAMADGQSFDILSGAAFAADTSYLVLMQLDANPAGADSLTVSYAAEGDTEFTTVITGQAVDTFDSVVDLNHLKFLVDGPNTGDTGYHWFFDEARLATTIADLGIIRSHDTATVTVTVTGQNDAPVGVADAASTGENTAADIDVLANDTDVDNGDDPSTFTLDSIDSVVVSGTTIDPTLVSGSVTIVANQVHFEPGTDFDELDLLDTATVTVGYTMSDDSSATSTATLTLTVDGANDTPAVAADNAAATADEGDTAANTGTFADVDAADTVTITASVGSITQDAGNSGVWNWSYVTMDGPSTQTVTITATDLDGATSTDTFNLTVNNLAPTANDDTSSTTDEDAVLNVVAPGVLGNDTDPAGANDPLSVIAVNGAGGVAPFSSTSMLGAQVTMRADGSYDYDSTNAAALQMLSAGESRTDSFTYSITDGDGGTDTATVSITVTSTDSIEINTNHDFVLPISAPPAVTPPVTIGGDGNGDSIQVDVAGGTLEIRVNTELLLTSALTGADITIVGSSDSDSVALNGLGGGAIDIQLAGGDNSLAIDDTTDTTDDTAIVATTTAINGLIDGGAALTFSGVSSLSLTLGSGNDSIDLNAATGGSISTIDVSGGAGDDRIEMTTNQSTDFTVHGDTPAVSPGDTLVINLNNVAVPVLFAASTDGVFSSQGTGGANRDIVWTGMESFIFDGEDFQAGDLYALATPGPDRMIFTSGVGGTVIARINNVFHGPFDITGTIVALGEDGKDSISISGNLKHSVEFHGGDGSDNLIGGRLNDLLVGDAGNDVMLSGDGDNTMYGGTGNDWMSARGGRDVLVGQNGNDSLHGGSGADVLIGDDLNDLLAIGNDRMAGGEGDDLLVGGLGNDILSGGFGDDVLIGNEGNDLLRGNQNEDLLIGGSGEDTMLGQSGIDRLADGVAANEGDETSLLALWTEWSGPSSGLLRIYTNAGGFTTDGDADFLSGGGAIDAINFGAEDGDPLQSGDLAF